jgi:uncharacterized protein YegP (UPF0339 family)
MSIFKKPNRLVNLLKSEKIQLQNKIEDNSRALEQVTSSNPKTTSYIEIHQTKKRNFGIRIKGGNHKIKFNTENYYSHPNAVRAANLFSKETGLKVVDRTEK